MKIVVFKGGLGNQLFQYAFYKYLSRKDETFYFYNDAWYNVSHNGFELDKYFKTRPTILLILLFVAFGYVIKILLGAGKR